MKKKFELPVYNFKAIIFVPIVIVRLENVAGQNLACFYRFAIKHFIVHINI